MLLCMVVITLSHVDYVTFIIVETLTEPHRGYIVMYGCGNPSLSLSLNVAVTLTHLGYVDSRCSLFCLSVAQSNCRSNPNASRLSYLVLC